MTSAAHGSVVPARNGWNCLHLVGLWFAFVGAAHAAGALHGAIAPLAPVRAGLLLVALSLFLGRIGYFIGPGRPAVVGLLGTCLGAIGLAALVPYEPVDLGRISMLTESGDLVLGILCVLTIVGALVKGIVHVLRWARTLLMPDAMPRWSVRLGQRLLGFVLIWLWLSADTTVGQTILHSHARALVALRSRHVGGLDVIAEAVVTMVPFVVEAIGLLAGITALRCFSAARRQDTGGEVRSVESWFESACALSIASSLTAQALRVIGIAVGAAQGRDQDLIWQLPALIAEIGILAFAMTRSPRRRAAKWAALVVLVLASRVLLGPLLSERTLASLIAVSPPLLVLAILSGPSVRRRLLGLTGFAAPPASTRQDAVKAIVLVGLGACIIVEFAVFHLYASQTMMVLRWEAEGGRVAPPQEWALVQETSTFCIYLGCLGYFVACRLFLRGLRYWSTNVEEARSTDGRAPVLWLRAFKDDDVRAPERWGWRRMLRAAFMQPRGIRVEVVVREALQGVGPFIALGSPRDELPPLGASKTYLDEGWRQSLSAWVRDAALVVVLVRDTRELQFEIETIAREGAMSRTIFLLPPRAAPEDVEVMRSWIGSYGSCDSLGPLDRAVAIALAGRSLIVESFRRTETSYSRALTECLLLVDDAGATAAPSPDGATC